MNNETERKNLRFYDTNAVIPDYLAYKYFMYYLICPWSKFYVFNI